MQSGGADVIELGVPFSDPVADGPIIQKTNAVSAKNALPPPAHTPLDFSQNWN